LVLLSRFLCANAELPFQEAAKKLSQDVIKLAWFKATVKALSTKILPADSNIYLVRDCLFWRLLRVQQANGLSNIIRLSGNLNQGAGSTYLIDLGTANDELRRIILPFVQEEMSHQIGEELMNGLLQDDDIATAAQGKNKTKVIKKKKRKGKRLLQEGPVTEETEVTSDQSGVGDDIFVKSMFVDFFMKDEQEPKMVNEKNASSSTAAAIASSSDKIGSDNNSDVDTRLEIDFLNPIGGSTTQILTDMAEAEYLIIGKFSAETVTYGAPLECLMVECSESIGYFSPTSPFMIEDHFKTC
jgi:hypothetical protein